MNSDARGSVLIKSSDPKEKPAIRFNYLFIDQDRREWVEAIRCARILNQPAMEEFNGGNFHPDLPLIPVSKYWIGLAVIQQLPYIHPALVLWVRIICLW